MSPSSLPPSGWYGDPAGTGGSRWWDGTTWTEHVRAGPPNDDPPPVPHEATAGAPPWDTTRPSSSSRRARTVTMVASVVLLLGLGATVVVGLRPGLVETSAAAPTPLDRDRVEASAQAAGCTVTADEPLDDRTHLDPADAPPPEALYPRRPAHSGPHYAALLALPRGVSERPIDERAVLHNMEHGSVVVWFDPDVLDDADRDTIAAWRDHRADLGFTSPSGGAIFASPVPPMEDPPAVALRAWGVAMDCDRFDAEVADAFLAEHWGSHGAAPESHLSPYPEETVHFREDV